MEWLHYFLVWYVYLFLLGAIFYPLTRRFFRHSLDGGYAFAKIIGIMTLSYIMLVLGVLRLVPFTRGALLGILLVIAFFAYRRIIRGRIVSLLERHAPLLGWILIEEAIFFIGLLAWTIVRGQEPAVHGLEKFMDYGFMQSIGRSVYFPPLDMWYGADMLGRSQGYPINYYYFGHLTGALLIKLTDVPAAVGYNLILANILALSMSAVFSLIINVLHFAGKQMRLERPTSVRKLLLYGLLGAILLNTAGNTHTLYLFTRGYPNESPLPPWDSAVRPDVGQLAQTVWKNKPDVLYGLQEYSHYWYPNATRFIPLTIHEFPAYSYVVADLHGHVFDIPFVLLTLAVLLLHVVPILSKRYFHYSFDPPPLQASSGKALTSLQASSGKASLSAGQAGPLVQRLQHWWQKCLQAQVPLSIFLGFMAAVHYMTNAFDGPIYLLLGCVTLLLVHRFTMRLLGNMIVMALAFFYFSVPFSLFFQPFVSGIGVNCGYPLVASLAKDAATYKIGPFLFEKGNCQHSAAYQVLMIWGHFWIHAILLGASLWIVRKSQRFTPVTATSVVMGVLFAFGTLLIIIPEFFYIKDIYPTHFRANTIFKLGYQAYMMMSIASVYTIWRLRHMQVRWFRIASRVLSVAVVMLVLVYMRFAVSSYYGSLQRPVKLDGIAWLNDQYPETHDIIEYFNSKVTGQPVILEAQGDSYTDYNVVSAYTGLPTVAGWWVHEWLWRGNADIVGKRIPDIENMYRSADLELTRSLLRRYKVEYVVVSELERKRYQVNDLKIDEEKFATLGREIFRSVNGKGIVYKIN